VRRLLSIGALGALLAAAFAGSAAACSCAPTEPTEALRESDGAIVGRLVKIVPRGMVQADYRYEVHRVYRGARTIEQGQMLSVRSARRAAACALPRRLDRRYGLFLTRASGHWRAGICSVISPRRLWKAAKGTARATPRPAPWRRPVCDGGGTSPRPT
jgi:hypothetical protein